MTADHDLASTAATAPEVDLTTFGRRSGRPSRNTIWITTDAQGRIHIRSGQGLVRDWPQNLLANGHAILHIDGKDFAVQARHVTDRAELLASRDAVKAKYGRERSPTPACTGSTRPGAGRCVSEVTAKTASSAAATTPQTPLPSCTSRGTLAALERLGC